MESRGLSAQGDKQGARTAGHTNDVLIEPGFARTRHSLRNTKAPRPLRGDRRTEGIYLVWTKYSRMSFFINSLRRE